MRSPITGVLLALAVVTFAACGDDGGSNNGGGNTEGSYLGTFASAGFSGAITVDVPAASPAPRMEVPTGPALSSPPVGITGTLIVTGGNPVTLTGSLNGVAMALDGAGFTFNGTLSNGSLSGTFTDPNGQTGTFRATITTANAQVKVFCGSYSGTDDSQSPESGVFNLMYNANGKGNVVTADDADGSISVFNVRTSGNFVQVFDPSFPNFNIVDDGVISGTAIDGTYDTGSSAGTFHGGTDECQ